MIVVMKKGAAGREIDAVVARIEELGFRADPSRGALSGGPQSLTPAMLADLVVRVRAVARAVGRSA